MKSVTMKSGGEYMSDYIPDVEYEEICETDGDFFKELFEMERQIITEVEAEKKKKEETSKHE